MRGGQDEEEGSQGAALLNTILNVESSKNIRANDNVMPAVLVQRLYGIEDVLGNTN